MLTESIGSTISVFDKIPHVVIGGHAVSAHSQQRATLDVDLLIKPEDLENVRQYLPEGSKTSPLQMSGIVPMRGISVTLPDNMLVDFITADEEWVDDAINHPTIKNGIRFISMEYLILLKLIASRGTVDDSDIIQLLKVMDKSTFKLTRQIVRRYLPNDLYEDFLTMVKLAQWKATSSDSQTPTV